MFLAIIGGCLLFARTVISRTYWGIDFPAPFVDHQGKVLRMAGDIGAPMVRKLSLELFHSQYEALDFRSGGGSREAADEIIHLLRVAGLPLFLSKKAFCGSACVKIYAETITLLGDDSAHLGFHAGQWQFTFGGLRGDPSNVNEMREWAREISQRLPEYFSHCAVDPTSRKRFFYISVAEIRNVDAGAPERDCNAQAEIGYEVGGR